jgi:hypothetical protein
MRFFGIGRAKDTSPRGPVPIDQDALRDQMTRDDPEHARARRVLHEGKNLLAFERNRDWYEAEQARRGRNV